MCNLVFNESPFGLENLQEKVKDEEERARFEGVLRDKQVVAALKEGPPRRRKKEKNGRDMSSGMEFLDESKGGAVITDPEEKR